MQATLNRLRAPYALQGYTGLGLEFKLLGRIVQLVVAWLQARWSLRKADRLGKKVFAYGRPDINFKRGAHMEFGEEVRIWSDVYQVRLSVHHKGRLIVGNDIRLCGCIISASSEVTIGDRARIAPGVHIMDGDFHDTDDHTVAGRAGAIHIGADAWIATRSMVMKGVTVGEKAVVAAGAVVVKDVEPYTMVAGVPAKVIKRLKGYDAWKQRQEASSALGAGDADNKQAVAAANTASTVTVTA